MIFYQIQFGPYEKDKKSETFDLVDSYLSSLIRNGQIFYDTTVVPWLNEVCAYVHAVGPNADRLKYHSQDGLKHLSEVIKCFGQKPNWTLHEDLPPKRNVSWKNAETLFLYTDFSEKASPVSHGSRERDIPLYLLPISDNIRDEIYCWQRRYKHLDQIWFDSQSLEIQAYHEMVDLNSELTKEGRRLRGEIEKATKIPTYYYLKRFFCYKKQEKEESRPCPGCGESWRTHHGFRSHFFQFDFRCISCRLVSHIGSFTSDRYAKMGAAPK